MWRAGQSSSGRFPRRSIWPRTTTASASAAPRVEALYRYPVKGFTPEACDELLIEDTGRVAGDRVLGFRLAGGTAADDEWGPKAGFVVLMNTPGLARLRLRYDHAALRLRITLDGSVLVEAGLDPVGREELAAAVGEFVRGLEESPVKGHPERLPLRLVGDGVTPRFQDRATGLLTVHGRESLAALASALDDPALSERRFRSNVAVSGFAAWEEQSWLGRRVRIGDMTWRGSKPVHRCLAPQANPDTGERDAPILTTLTEAFRQELPTFAVALALAGRGGTIRIGDPVHAL